MIMKRVLIIIVAALVFLVAAASVATAAYTRSEDSSADRLPDNISVNGVDVSGMSYEEAAKVLTEAQNAKHLQVVGKLGETLEDYTDFDCTYDIEDQLKNLKKDHRIASALGHYLHIPINAQIAMNIKDCSDDFADRVKNSKFLDHGTIVETQDAYVDMDDPTFPIIPEVYGNKTDGDAYLADILHAITMNMSRFEFDENAYRSMPKVKSDDPELLRYQKFCRAYLNQKITYELGKDTFTLSVKELHDLMKDDLSGEADSDKVKKYVKKLKKEYDIVGGEHKFTSLTGKTFTVNGGSYGWIIDEEGEAKKLKKNINSHEDVSRSPVFSQKGNGEYSKTLDLGNTYIDVDLSKQHVVYFENGKKKFESDCVSGCVAAGHSTPTGIFSINNKARNIKLVGGGPKKSKTHYESFVSYWMCFLGYGYGLHDATWRSNFGGDIYKYSGSHGCVNLPPAKAGELYDLISVGTIVIVHN